MTSVKVEVQVCAEYLYNSAKKRAKKNKHRPPRQKDFINKDCSLHVQSDLVVGSGHAAAGQDAQREIFLNCDINVEMKMLGFNYGLSHSRVPPIRIQTRLSSPSCLIVWGLLC
jgi:hypothetical protein